MGSSPSIPKAQSSGSRKSNTGWRQVRFGDVVECVNDTRADPQAPGIERVVGLDHLDPGSLHIKRWADIEEGTTFTRRFRSGQVLFGKRRAYQRKLAVAEFDGICSGDILVFEPKNDDMISELLPFIMQAESFWQHALDTSAGSLSPRTKWQDLARYEFALPPKDEQRRVAEILWAADEHIETLKDAADAVASLKENFLDSELAWKTGRKTLLGDVLEFVEYGCSKRSSRNTAGGVPILGIPHVVSGGIKMGDLPYVELSTDEIQRFSLAQGDILVVRTNGNPDYVGRGAVVTALPATTVFASYLLRLRFQPSKVIPDFAGAVLQSKQFRLNLRKEVKSSAGNFNLNTQGLRKQEIPLLSLDEQSSLIKKLRKFVESHANCQDQLQKATDLKAGLLSSLLCASSGG